MNLSKISVYCLPAAVAYTLPFYGSLDFFLAWFSQPSPPIPIRLSFAPWLGCFLAWTEENFNLILLPRSFCFISWRYLQFHVSDLLLLQATPNKNWLRSLPSASVWHGVSSWAFKLPLLAAKRTGKFNASLWPARDKSEPRTHILNALTTALFAA